MDWQKAYEDGHTPWDLRGVTGPLRRLAKTGFLQGLQLPPRAQVAVPGCGRGHDLLVFARLGQHILGFDIAPAAVAEARSLVTLNRIAAEVLVRDVLGLAEEFPGSFDLVYDYACFSSLAKHLRRAYGRELAAITAPSGYLLLLAFPMRPDAAGPLGRPPFLVLESDLTAALTPHFSLVQSFAAEDSAVERRGAERWFLYRKPPLR